MRNWTTLGRTSALALLLGSTSALADVSAADVWADWKGLMESYGMTVTTASEAQSGGTLTVTGFDMAMDMPDGSVKATLDEVVFAEQGDGTVAITMSPEYRIVISASPAGGDLQQTTMAVRQGGFRMVASGDAALKAYDFSSSSIGIGLVEVLINGQNMPGTVDFTMSEASGKYTVATADTGRTINSDFNAASMNGIVDVNDPDTGGSVKMNFAMSDLTSTSSGVLPPMLDLENMDAMLKAGLASGGTLGYGATTFGFDINDASTVASGSGKADGGNLEFKIAPDGLVYGTSSNGLEFNMTSSDIPLPVAFAIAEGAFRLAMPVQRSDAPAAFSLLTSYKGVTISEGIWGMFDPMQQLPRDPINIVVDLAGSAKWLVDIMNPEAAANIMGPPAEVNDLSLNEVELTVAGASLTGSGNFTFDNADMSTFPGMPKPTGAVDLALSGGNGLLDKLVGMGLIPQDEAMGFRMMLGLFARPGDGPDSLVSRIEVTADGQVLANGQRIR